MQLLVGAHRDRTAYGRFELAKDAAALVFQGAGDLRIYPEDNAVPVEIGTDLLDLGQDVVADRRAGLDGAGAGAVRTGFGQRALQAALHPLAGDDDEAEIGDLDRLRRRPILAELLLDGLRDFLTVLLLLHVDEV